MKKLLFFFLTLFATGSLFAQTFSSGGINYQVTSATAPLTVRVGGNAGFSGVANIPSTVTLNAVTYSVTSITESAFDGCNGLTSITLPNSLTSIESYAFFSCIGLTSLTLPNSLTSIGDGAFNSCTGLTSITLSNSLTSIGNSAFRDCTGLTSLTLPNSLTSINGYAFENCTGLTSLTLPNSLTSIGNFNFRSCSGLTSLILPNSITTIGEDAFSFCTSLTSLTLPSSLTSVGNYAFASCTGLTTVNVGWSIPLPISDLVFNGVTLFAVALNVPNGTSALYDAAAFWTNFNIVLPPPTITSFTPLTAKPGDVVAISGTGFNTTTTNNVVFFGTTRATVTAATANSLTVTVPVGATYAPITILNTSTSLAAFSRVNFTPTYSPAKNNITATDFQAKQDFTTGFNPFSVAIGDLDGDGKPDLAVANFISNTVSVFRNISTSGSITSVSFATKVDFTTGTYPYSVAIGDLDGDGKPDLAVSNNDSNTVSILRNTSTSGSIISSSFASKVDFVTGNQPYSVAIGDLDGDGKHDLTVANRISNTVSIFRNTSTSGSLTSGSFAAKVDFVTGNQPYSVAIGDLDGDGKPDLAVSNNDSNTVSIFRNTANSGSITASSFAAKVDFTTGSYPITVSIGDLDSDGKLDLAVSNGGSSSFSVFRNTSTSGSISSSSFASKVDFTSESNSRSIVLGDMDGDGKPDLAVANYASNTISIFRNTAIGGSITSGSFATKVDFATGVSPQSVAIGDLDGDGKPDLAVANSNSNSVSLFRNNNNNSNLSALTTSRGVLSPVFATATTSYTTTICGGTGFTVTPTVQDTNATIEVRSNGGAYVAVLSASPSQVLALNIGSNTVEVKVTAQNGTVATTTITVTANVTAAPSATAQTFCNAGTVANLVPSGSGIQWYDVASGGTALAPATALIAGNYYASQTISGCESVSRTLVVITINANPAAPMAVDQTLCFNGTVANLSATGTGIKWYNVASGGTALAPATAATATTYYASQTIAGCESTSRTAIVVTLNNTIPTMPTAMMPQVYTTGATVSSITTSAVNPKWYTTQTLGVTLASNTTLVDGTTYYVGESTNGCESARVAVVVRKISEASQTLCAGASVAGLTATPSSGATANWFSLASGGVALSSSEPLATGIYYVEQASNAGPASTTLHTALGSLSDVAVQADGKIVYVDAFNSLIRRMDANGTNHVTLSTAFNTPTGIAIDAAGKILVTSASSTIGRMNADGTNIVELGSGFLLPESVAVQANGKILVINGDDIKRMDADGTNIVTIGGGFFIPQALIEQPDGKILVADSFNAVIKRMDADGLNVVELGGPNFSFPSSIALQADGKILIADDGEIKRMNADGSNLVTLLSGLQGTADIAVEADGKIIAGVNGNNNDYSVQRLSTASVATSNRVAVAITTINETIPPTASTQTFEKYTTTANLVASGTNLKWYNVSVNGSVLANNAPIYSGTYYVSQTINGCESASRTAVTISVNTATWDGSAWVNAIVPDATKGAVFIGNYAQATNIVAKGVEVIGTSIVTVPTGFDFTVDNWIEVASTSSFVFENNANLIQAASATVAVGNVTIKRNTSMQRLAYTNWASPVAAQNILAFSPLTYILRFYFYNESTNTFLALSSPETHNMFPTLGYSLRAPNTFADAPSAATAFVGTFTGIPNNGNYSYPATKDANGYNLTGNPYPSTMLASAFFTANPLVGVIYFWNNTVLDAPPGHNFATKTSATSVRAAADINSLKVPTDFIGVGQGFFIQVSSATNVVFTNEMRSSENTPVFFRNANTDKSLFKLNLLSPTNTFNQIAIVYMNGATNVVDNQIDAVPFAQSPTMVSSLINNVDYVIQGRSLPFANTDVVPLGFKTDVAGNYSFNSEAFEGVFANNQNIFLKDNLTGTTHSIKQSPYSFTTNVGTFNNRFEIVYQSNLSIENPNFNDNNVFVFVKNNNININSGNINMKNIQVYDIRGRLVFDKKEVNATQFEIENLKVEQAVLIVKITSEDGSIVTKKIVY